MCICVCDFCGCCSWNPIRFSRNEISFVGGEDKGVLVRLVLFICYVNEIVAPFAIAPPWKGWWMLSTFRWTDSHEEVSGNVQSRRRYPTDNSSSPPSNEVITKQWNVSGVEVIRKRFDSTLLLIFILRFGD